MPSKFDKLYKKADEYEFFNDKDPALKPFKISLPKPPKLELIDGYGLHPKEQYFKVSDVPVKLKQLEKQCIKAIQDNFNNSINDRVTYQKIYAEIWDRLDKNKIEYKDEIQWIKKQIWHIWYGYWFFNNGKPTYITGNHYGYLNFWNLDIGKPEYRDRTRRNYLIRWFAQTNTQDEKGNDLGRRLFYGIIKPKMRREGGTNEVISDGYFYIMKRSNADMGIQSDTGAKSEQQYKKFLIPAWQKLPFFLRPIWRGNNNPDEIQFILPQDKQVGDCLENSITYASTVMPSFWDGKKLYYALLDEEGKTTGVDVTIRWEIVQKCMALGSDIFGYSEHPSTVEDMETMGGSHYKSLWDKSDIHVRVEDIGETGSGLIGVFDPAWYCLEGFVGKYGESIHDDPTQEQYEDLKVKYGNKAPKIGAKKFLLSKRDFFIKKGDTVAAIREAKRFPFTIDECFYGAAGNLGLNLDIINRRITELEKYKKETNREIGRRGNFMWQTNSGIIYSASEIISKGFNIKTLEGKVIFQDNENGVWYLTYIPQENESNLKYKVDDHWYPQYSNRFTNGADPYHWRGDRESSGKNSKLSKGGGSIIRHRDFKIDIEGRDMREWETYGICGTYEFSYPDEDVFVLDQLFSCIYYGSMMYPETNVKIVLKMFHKWGYAGYLKHDIDLITGDIKEQAGNSTQTASKQALFTALANYINRHGHKCNHIDFLYQCRDIKRIEDLNSFDLLAACMYGIEGSQSEYGKVLEDYSSNTFELTEIFDYLK